MTAFTESVVEDAALAWLESLGWTVKHGPDIAPGELAAERTDYAQVILTERLRQALARLNPALPPEALADAFRKLTRPEGPTLEARNRALHRLLVDGVTVEYRRSDGSIAGGRPGSSISTSPRTTTGSRSTSTRSARASTPGARTWCSSSTACRSSSWSSRTRRTKA